jgi:hypothetical protein
MTGHDVCGGGSRQRRHRNESPGLNIWLVFVKEGYHGLADIELRFEVHIIPVSINEHDQDLKSVDASEMSPTSRGSNQSR